VTETVEDGIQGGEPKMPGGRGSSEVVDRAEVVKPTEGGDDVVGDRNGVRHGHEQGRTSIDLTRRSDLKTGGRADECVVKKRVGVSVGSRSGQFEAQGPDLKNSLTTFPSQGPA